MDRQYLSSAWDHSVDNLMQYSLLSSRPDINLQQHSTPLAVNTSEKADAVASREGLFNISCLTSPAGSMATDEGYSSISTPLSLPRYRQPTKSMHQNIQSSDTANRHMLQNRCDSDHFTRQRCFQTPNIMGYTIQQAVQRPSNSVCLDDWLSPRHLKPRTLINTDALNAFSADEAIKARRNSAFVQPTRERRIDHLRNSLLFNENKDSYQQTIAHIRQEMIDLIEIGMRHLEGYFRGMPQSQLDENILHMNLSSATEPLNLRSDNSSKFRLLDSTYSIPESNQPIFSTRPWGPGSISSVVPTLCNDNQIHMDTTTTPMPTTTKSQHGRQIKSPQKQRRRRMRIRTSGYRSRLGQANGGHLLTSGATSHLRLPLSPIRSASDSGLDLRVKQDRTGSRVEDNINDFPTKTKYTSLSASHLKRAKIMFMYARYPSSSLLKAHFPDVVFTRVTTAQVVKWFSNFREFFYIQIEKYARQCIIQGETLKDVVVTRNHELFRSLERHYNKDNDVESPNEFVCVTEVALREFNRAITSHHDKDAGWKREIYRSVVPYDCPFPDYVKNIK